MPKPQSTETGLAFNGAPAPAAFAVLSGESASIAEVLRENFGGDHISPTDFDRIRIPAGGGLSFTVPDLEGDVEVRDFSGIIVHVKRPRVYWEKEFSGEGTLPDCSSEDGIIGVGTPGGACDLCPLNQWGSATKGGSGKACKEQRLLFVLREGALLPVVVTLPPSSLGPLKKYLLRLSGQGIFSYGVVTKFSLERDKSETGIAYSKAVFAVADRLSADQVQQIKAYADAIRPSLERVRDDAAAVN